jgi:predicted protein tyrosine phosphatase
MSCAVHILHTVLCAAPSLEKLQQGISFAKTAPPGTITFIHCKGGIGRAATMALSFLMDKHAAAGMSPESGVERLIAKRHIVTPKILHYPVVKQLHGLLAAAVGKGDKRDPSVHSKAGEGTTAREEL